MLLTFLNRYSYIILLLFLTVGLFKPSIAVLAVVCMIGPVVFSFFLGRAWCGNICPRGNFFDNIISEFSNNKKVPWLFRNIVFRIAVAGFMFYFFINGILINWGNLRAVGMIFYKMIALTTIIGILLSFIFNHRTWCHFCPMGTISAFICSLNINRPTLRVSSYCINCRQCAKICPLSIKPYKYRGKALSHPDCIKCGRCIKVCPKKSIS